MGIGGYLSVSVGIGPGPRSGIGGVAVRGIVSDSVSDTATGVGAGVGVSLPGEDGEISAGTSIAGTATMGVPL